MGKGQDMIRKRRTDMVIRAKERAARAGLPFDLHVDSLEWPDRCPALGILIDYGPRYGHKQARGQGPEENSPSIDRIDPDLGYVLSNVQVVSMLANRIKSSAEAWAIRKVADWLHALEDHEKPWPEIERAPT